MVDSMKLPAEKTLILLMGWSFGVIAMIMICLCLFIPLSPEGKANVGFVVAYLAGSLNTLFGFYWGSSRGSEKKSDSITEIIKPVSVRMEEIKQKGLSDESIQKTERKETDC